MSLPKNEITQVKNSDGQTFEIDEKVGHEAKNSGEAKVKSFEWDCKNNEILVNTTKGNAHLDFIVKL